MSVARYSAACGEASDSDKPSRVARRQFDILAVRPSFSSSLGVRGANRRRFFSMLFRWALKLGSSEG